MMMMTSDKIDVLVEATGDPKIGVIHAQAAIRNGIHIVMVNVEADVLAGARLAQVPQRRAFTLWPMVINQR